MIHRSILKHLALGFSLVSPSLADSIDWSSKQQTLVKPGFDDKAAVHEVLSSDGAKVTFKLRHLGTTPERFTYSKWEIDRWGDPAGVFADLGSWQVVANNNNDVGLALWGYWGSGPTPLEMGDSTAYVLEIVFEDPVSNLSIPIHGIDALFDDFGSNAQDQVLVTAFLETADRTETVSFTNLGASVNLSQGSLIGDPAVEMGSVTGFYPVSDDGNATITITDKTNRVELVIVNYATHPEPAAFSNGNQNWSLSVGNLTFEPATAIDRVTVDWAPLQGELDKPGYDNGSDSFITTASNGTTQVTFDLNHIVTTEDKFGFSKWEINRWGDPDGIFTPLGSWQVPSNSVNDIVLAPWGFWGTDGSPNSTPTEIGDAITYQLIMSFSEPVTDLSFALHSIDAVLSAEFNTIDRMDLRAFNGGVAQPNPVSVGRWGQLAVIDGGIQGEYSSSSVEGIAATSDDGSVQVRFPEAVDQVDLTFTTTATHPTPAAFNGGIQNWSFSVSDLSFLTGIPTKIDWAPLRTQLQKEPFNNEPGTYEVVSEDGGVTAVLSMEHLGTTDDKFGYWKWEIDRWGDPAGLSTPEPGAFQIVTNEANDVVFGLWGYWGTDGSPGSPPVNVGDETTYRFSVAFDRPVKDLDFFLSGINGFLKPIDGFNSQDILTIEPSLNGVAQGSPVYSNPGDAFTRSGNVLTGDYDNQIVGVYGGQHVSDHGTIQVRLGDTVDRLDFTLINRAGHNNLAAFQNGLQTFSFAIGNLSFTYEPAK